MSTRETEKPVYSFRIVQRGIEVASGEAYDFDMLHAEAMRYARQYEEEGALTLHLTTSISMGWSPVRIAS